MRRLLLFLFTHRLLAIARWDLHFLRLRIRNAARFESRRIREFLATRERPLFLNLGSGPRGLDSLHWVNVDGFHDRNVHFLLDFNRPLPFPDGTFDGIFCEHVFEHFSLEDGERLAREALRLLRKGGCLRIVVPDAALLIRRYVDAPEDLVQRRGADRNMTAMEVVNLYFRQRYEHQFLFDWETLNRLLERAGFGRRARTRAGEAVVCPDIALDDEKYAWESLYVEAVKSDLVHAVSP